MVNTKDNVFVSAESLVKDLKEMQETLQQMRIDISSVTTGNVSHKKPTLHAGVNILEIKITNMLCFLNLGSEQ